MKTIKAIEIAKAVSGELLYGDPDSEANGVCIDSRKAERGQAFFALSGERVDGHDYLDDAIMTGCSVLVVSKIEAAVSAFAQNRGVALIRVENTEIALQEFAKYYLSLFPILKVAVTGSTGKTTTKEMLYGILSEKYQTIRNLGNYNNLIGLPLSVFEIGTETEAAVFEMGMDRPGEIRRLCEIVEPQIGLITNVGLSHIEHLGSRENILKAKMEMTERFTKDNTLVINTDNDMFCNFCPQGDYQVLRVGKGENSDFRIEKIKDLAEKGIEFTIKTALASQEFQVGLPGLHNASNAALAVAASLELGLSLEEAAKGLEKISNSDKRLHIIEKKGIKVIDDTYNASPDSMRAAIDVLTGLRGKRHIAILGDMYELGEKEEEYHFQIGEYASHAGVNVVISVGKNAGFIADGARASGTKAIHFETKDLLLVVLAQWIRPGDVILVKGSRGMAMEKIVEQIEKAGE
ncbi:MAG: UDP-N-acetylmuramoyl-tripeptide--D-alanyl-D-alanine ligase [Eubacteriales bacterium]|nr:UDP-N-acetylmuramoyl-tripeptide--D-alanyl-D-alanine ligase [Eubacteriales bacterium]